MTKQDLLIRLSPEEAEAVFSEVTNGMIFAEDQANKTNDLTAIPILVSRTVNLNAVYHRMEPYITSLLGHKTERDSTRSGAHRELPSGNR